MNTETPLAEPHEPLIVAVFILIAEQEAVAWLSVVLHHQVQPLPLVIGVVDNPTEHKPPVGAEVKDPPFEEPQTG